MSNPPSNHPSSNKQPDGYQFYGRYAPRYKQIKGLQPALLGSVADTDSQLPEYFAPTFTASPAFVAALHKAFDESAAIIQSAGRDVETDLLLRASALTESPHVQAAVQELAQNKARALNHYALCKRLANDLIENKPASAYLPEAQRFILELLEQNANTRSFLLRYFEFSAEELNIFESFVAHTVMALFTMGYPDAAHHSSQVARLCVVKAAAHGANRPEMLQAGIVGWLHDPKLMSILSIDNLSTHPVVASALAYGILSHPVLKSALTQYLKPLNIHPLSFIRGVTDALSVNNDSRFVAERFIFDQVGMQLVWRYGKTLGQHLKDQLWEVHQQRLAAPSRGESPEPFSKTLEESITQTRLDSGFIGIQKSAWLSTCEVMGFIEKNSTTSPEDQAKTLYETMINGEYPDLQAVHDLGLAFIEARELDAANTVVRWPVNGLYLFSHHDEVSVHGRQAALALVCSDPLMLSPHKIMEVRPAEEPLNERIQSYLESLNANLNDLPLQAQRNALTWKRSLYLCILKAAKRVVGRSRLGWFYETHQNTPIEVDLTTLEKLLVERETWQGWLDFNALGPHKTQFDDLVEALKEEYLEMCQQYRDAVLSQEINEAKIF